MDKAERLAAGRRLSRRHYLGASLAVAAGPLIPRPPAREGGTRPELPST